MWVEVRWRAYVSEAKLMHLELLGAGGGEGGSTLTEVGGAREGAVRTVSSETLDNGRDWIALLDSFRKKRNQDQPVRDNLQREKRDCIDVDRGMQV